MQHNAAFAFHKIERKKKERKKERKLLNRCLAQVEKSFRCNTLQSLCNTL